MGRYISLNNLLPYPQTRPAARLAVPRNWKLEIGSPKYGGEPLYISLLQQTDPIERRDSVIFAAMRCTLPDVPVLVEIIAVSTDTNSQHTCIFPAHIYQDAPRVVVHFHFSDSTIGRISSNIYIRPPGTRNSMTAWTSLVGLWSTIRNNMQRPAAAYPYSAVQYASAPRKSSFHVFPRPSLITRLTTSRFGSY